MQKLFDVVNKQDEIIGAATAQECHSNPKLIHRTVHFTLFDPKTNKILITQRSFDVTFDSGKWCFMGEHVLSGESYLDALIKGVGDELDIPSPIISIELAHTVFSYANQTEFIRFFIISWNGSTIHINQNEIIDYKWVTLLELQKNKNSYSKMTKHWIESVDWESLHT